MSGGFKDEGDFDWRRFEAMAKRYWRKVSDAADTDFSGWGGNIRVGRMLASGDLRLVALYYIDQSPRHGYDLIKAIEAQSNGFYAPSPGIVYPALTFLEEAGYVTSEADGNKKLYTITEAGKAHLAENREAVASTLDILAMAGDKVNKMRDFARKGFGASRDTFDDMRRPGWPFTREQHDEFAKMRSGWQREAEAERPDRDLEDVLPEVNAARRELKAAIKKAKSAPAEHQTRLAEILRKAAADIRALGTEDDEVDI
jgi:DNA-binding PadR family transcriptional regulator